MRIFFLFVLIVVATSARGQLVLTPILKEPTKSKSAHARTQDITPRSLPFWDDFATVKNGVADPTLWQFGNSVWINAGLGINPPSLNVATFDGLDSLGKPYNVTDILAKGFADKMVSAPLRLDEVAVANRTNVAITFYYQYKGRGEAPDAGDILSLHFKNNAGVWAQVWAIENNGTLADDQFVRVTIPITDDAYFHDTFQFRFQNFARLSGPYDTWHLDYIYINNGKTQVAPVFPLFPDRTVSQPLTSLFQNYRAVPVKHFFKDPAAVLTQPVLTLTNLRTDQVAPSGQPVSYSSEVKITSYKDELPTLNTVTLDTDADVLNPITYQDFIPIALQTLPDAASFDPDADSIFLKLKVIVDSGDDIAKPIPEADYDTDVFSPISFRSNDSTTASYALANYYAYDDGEAEYGAALNKAGAQVAYRFDMFTDEPDTIVAIDLYFPRFGDESSQSIQLQILKNLSTNTSDILYIGTLPIQRNSLNRFWRVTLPEPIGVHGYFHIGWRQTTSAIIAIGLDKNNVVADKIFVNLNGTWQPDNLAGSLMMRPVFGKGNGGGEIITGTPEFKTINPYPNPNTGVFYIDSGLEQIQISDLAGRPVAIQTESSFDKTKISILTPVAGIYVLRARQGNHLLAQKLIVR